MLFHISKELLFFFFGSTEIYVGGLCDWGDGQTEAVCESVAAESLYELTNLLWAAGRMCCLRWREC